MRALPILAVVFASVLLASCQRERSGPAASTTRAPSATTAAAPASSTPVVEAPSATPSATPSASPSATATASGTASATPSPTPAPRPATDTVIDTRTWDVRSVDIVSPRGEGPRIITGSGLVRDGTALWVKAPDGIALTRLDGTVIETLAGATKIEESIDGDVRIVYRPGAKPYELVARLEVAGTVVPDVTAAEISPSGNHYWVATYERGKRDKNSFDMTLKIIDRRTGDQRTITYPFEVGGGDFRLLYEAISARWSPSGRFIVYQEIRWDGPRTMVVYDAETGRSRRFEEPCPAGAARELCYRPWPWWAPGEDQLLVPARWSEDDGLVVGVYHAALDQVFTPFPAAVSRRLAWASGTTVRTWDDEQHTVLYEALSGVELGRWAHNPRGGGYESQGEPDAYVVGPGVVAYALITTHTGWSTYYSRPNTTTCPGVEAFHPALTGGSACIDAPGAVWPSWSPSGDRLVITSSEAFDPETRGAGRTDTQLSVRVLAIEQGALREVFSAALGTSEFDAPRPFWSPDGRYLVIRRESTQI